MRAIIVDFIAISVILILTAITSALIVAPVLAILVVINKAIGIKGEFESTDLFYSYITLTSICFAVLIGSLIYRVWPRKEQ